MEAANAVAARSYHVAMRINVVFVVTGKAIPNLGL